jgi:hypothetical protein
MGKRAPQWYSGNSTKHKASGTYFMAVQARFVSKLSAIAASSQLGLKRVDLDLKLLPEGPAIGKSRYRSAEYRTFKHALP